MIKSQVMEPLFTLLQASNNNRLLGKDSDAVSARTVYVCCSACLFLPNATVWITAVH